MEEMIKKGRDGKPVVTLDRLCREYQLDKQLVESIVNQVLESGKQFRMPEGTFYPTERYEPGQRTSWGFENNLWRYVGFTPKGVQVYVDQIYGRRKFVQSFLVDKATES